MKVQCRECEWIGLEAELLRGENPFKWRDTIEGCPNCFAPVPSYALVFLCDEAGCKSEGSCGTPTATGYRRTCMTHYPKEGK